MKPAEAFCHMNMSSSHQFSQQMHISQPLGHFQSAWKDTKYDWLMNMLSCATCQISLCQIRLYPYLRAFVGHNKFVWQLIRGVGILHCNLHLMRFSGCLRGVQCCVTCISIRLPYYLHGSNHSILVLYWIIAWRDHKARS